MISLCNGWEFTEQWSEGFAAGEGSFPQVRLPHNVREVPLHYADKSDYEMICGYRRVINIPEICRGKRLFLQFDGAAHIATVYVNGKELTTHRCGYTAFRVEITRHIQLGADNRIAVRLDCTENPSVPPFGFVIDYLTYSGLYREAWLDVREDTFLEDIFVTTPDLKTAKVSVTVNSREADPSVALSVEISDADGCTVADCDAIDETELTISVPGARSWSPEHPVLYTCTAILSNGDRISTTFGFRTVVFTPDALLLNGEKVFMRGLNRHQNYPYLGYAAPRSLQREDARILKEELQCNAVRTSHYPQSKYFIDECDRLGLLVFTEIPGWQHIGDEDWKEIACENTREMVLQYRNHPSIVLWGVRINESQDDDALYRRTNAIAHELDPSRPTSGVRYLQKSSLLEDVYAYNDFSHTGSNPGVVPKKSVTPNMEKALFVSECNGHMFPTKSFESWERRQEHALRHARVHDGALADGQHVGCFGWCMFDYPTHKDFGSGDRVCYHGVMDAFRNPKLAAASYASQGELSPVLEIGSTMDIGDYPGGMLGPVYAFTNADSVSLYKNDAFVASFTPKGWKGLKHGPILIDDIIGELLQSQEGFEPAKAELLRSCLVAAGKYGLPNMPLFYKLKMGYAMLRYHMSYNDGYQLYGKYVGNWGGASVRWRFDAIKDGKVVSSTVCCPSAKLHLEVKASALSLTEGSTYDMASVRVRILDENNRIAPFAQLPVQFRLEGDLELVGPDTAAAEGGMCGCYVRTLGRNGSASLTISAGQTESVTLNFTIGGC